MKRIISLVLSCVLMLSATAMIAFPAAATSDMKTSDALVEILKEEEGFVKYPMWDYSQYSIGYGTRCPDDMVDYYRANGITKAEAEMLLRNHLSNTEFLINTYLIDKYDLDMTQGQFDALVSFSYNMGNAWIKQPDQNIHQKVISGATGNEIVDALSRWCKAGGKVVDYLLRRRLSEARMYIEGVYDRIPPDNYCFVTYNGNGGSISHTAQGYCTDYEATPSATAQYGNYTFTGWYTDQIGGTRVDNLTAVHNGMILYAHWAELHPETDENTQPVTVTITEEAVNIRKGPGTNYAIVDVAAEGEQYEITQIYENGGYLWGYSSSGWIALRYTNYDSVKPEPVEPDVTEPEETEPDTTEPDTTEPEETEPDVTEPELTEPEVTEPPVTEPAPTEPEPTEPPATEPAKVTGVVNANPYLCVRSGPGTAYGTVDTLLTGERVVILEQKTVGSMIWGRVSGGWISMSYVILDKTTQPAPDVENPTGKTGTVTCSVLNIRKGAGVSYSLAGHYIKNDTVVILEQKTVGSTTWGKTDKGWVSMDYISLKNQGSADTGTSNPETPAPQTWTGIVISDDVLRVRAGAGTSYSIVGFLQPGTKVTVTAQKTVGAVTWGKTSQGWISMGYVKLDSTEEEPEVDEPAEKPEEPADVRTVTVSVLNVRKGAGTNYSVVNQLARGAKVTITEIVTVGGVTWGKMSLGWICLDYTK